jgi:hypothetical protein
LDKASKNKMQHNLENNVLEQFYNYLSNIPIDKLMVNSIVANKAGTSLKAVEPSLWIESLCVVGSCVITRFSLSE